MAMATATAPQELSNSLMPEQEEQYFHLSTIILRALQQSDVAGAMRAAEAIRDMIGLEHLPERCPARILLDVREPLQALQQEQEDSPEATESENDEDEEEEDEESDDSDSSEEEEEEEEESESDGEAVVDAVQKSDIQGMPLSNLRFSTSGGGAGEDPAASTEDKLLDMVVQLRAMRTDTVRRLNRRQQQRTVAASSGDAGSAKGRGLPLPSAPFRGAPAPLLPIGPGDDTGDSRGDDAADAADRLTRNAMSRPRGCSKGPKRSRQSSRAMSQEKNNKHKEEKEAKKPSAPPSSVLAPQGITQADFLREMFTSSGRQGPPMTATEAEREIELCQEDLQTLLRMEAEVAREMERLSIIRKNRCTCTSNEKVEDFFVVLFVCLFFPVISLRLPIFLLCNLLLISCLPCASRIHHGCKERIHEFYDYLLMYQQTQTATLHTHKHTDGVIVVRLIINTAAEERIQREDHRLLLYSFAFPFSFSPHTSSTILLLHSGYQAGERKRERSSNVQELVCAALPSASPSAAPRWGGWGALPLPPPSPAPRGKRPTAPDPVGAHGDVSTPGDPCGDPVCLQQRVRRLVVQCCLLRSPADPLSLSQLLRLFCLRSAGEDAMDRAAAALPPKGSSSGLGERVLDDMTLEWGGKARTAVLSFQQHRAAVEASDACGAPNRTAMLDLQRVTPAEASRFYQVDGISDSILRSVGRKYVEWYQSSVLQLVHLGSGGAAPTPPPEEVLQWIVYGLLLSDPYFRLVGDAQLGSADPVVLYPVSPALLLFTWDLEAFWAEVKVRWQRLAAPKQHARSPAHTQQAEEEAMERVLCPEAVRRSATSSTTDGWTLWHSLYYVTSSPAVNAAEVLPIFARPTTLRRPDDRQQQDVPDKLFWQALLQQWTHSVDANLPDNLGATSVLPEPTASKTDEVTAERKALVKRYRCLPHVGYREYRFGSMRLRKLFESAGFGPSADGQQQSSDAGPASPRRSPLRHLMYQLFTQGQNLQAAPPGGGFYRSLERLNTRLLGELAAGFWIAPVPVSRLAAVLNWHGKGESQAIAEAALFREQSLLYFLLWIGGQPMLHRTVEHQVSAARAMASVRAALSTPTRSPRGAAPHTHHQSLPPMEACVDFVPGGASDPTPQHPPKARWSERTLLEREAAFLHALHDKVHLSPPPVTTERLAFFVLTPPREQENSPSTGAHSSILLRKFRGRALRRVGVLHTTDFTPMETWEALRAEILVTSTTTPPAACSHGVHPSTSSSMEREWTLMEPFVWVVPYSVLKRRLLRVAKGWCQFHAGADPTTVGPGLEHSVLSIRQWAQAALWEQELGGGGTCAQKDKMLTPSIACEMLWALLCLADPDQTYFKVVTPIPINVGDVRIRLRDCRELWQYCGLGSRLFVACGGELLDFNISTTIIVRFTHPIFVLHRAVVRSMARWCLPNPNRKRVKRSKSLQRRRGVQRQQNRPIRFPKPLVSASRAHGSGTQGVSLGSTPILYYVVPLGSRTQPITMLHRLRFLGAAASHGMPPGASLPVERETIVPLHAPPPSSPPTPSRSPPPDDVIAVVEALLLQTAQRHYTQCLLCAAAEPYTFKSYMMQAGNKRGVGRTRCLTPPLFLLGNATHRCVAVDGPAALQHDIVWTLRQDEVNLQLCKAFGAHPESDGSHPHRHTTTTSSSTEEKRRSSSCLSLLDYCRHMWPGMAAAGEGQPKMDAVAEVEVIEYEFPTEAAGERVKRAAASPAASISALKGMNRAFVSMQKWAKKISVQGRLLGRPEMKESVVVRSAAQVPGDGTSEENEEQCGPDAPRLQAMLASSTDFLSPDVARPAAALYRALESSPSSLSGRGGEYASALRLAQVQLFAQGLLRHAANRRRVLLASIPERYAAEGEAHPCLESCDALGGLALLESVLIALSPSTPSFISHYFCIIFLFRLPHALLKTVSYYGSTGEGGSSPHPHPFFQMIKQRAGDEADRAAALPSKDDQPCIVVTEYFENDGEVLHSVEPPAAVKPLPMAQSLGLASVYVGCSVTYFLLIRSQKSKGVEYDPVLIVFCLELVKLLVCLIAYRLEYNEPMFNRLFFAQGGGFRQSSAELWREGTKYAVPSLVYAIYNNMTYFNLQMMDVSTYQVFLQSKTLITGILFTYFLRKYLTARQWFALVLVMIGVGSKFVRLDAGSASPETSSASSTTLFALLCVMAQGSLSAFAGVYNEYVLKKDWGQSIHIQNFFMYFYSLIFNIMIAMWTTSITAIDYSVLKRPVFISLVFLGAFTGLAASFLLKFINVVVKGLAASVEVTITAVAASIVLGEPCRTMDVVAVVIVTVAVYTYYSKGYGDKYYLRCGIIVCVVRSERRSLTLTSLSGVVFSRDRFEMNCLFSISISVCRSNTFIISKGGPPLALALVVVYHIYVSMQEDLDVTPKGRGSDSGSDFGGLFAEADEAPPPEYPIETLVIDRWEMARGRAHVARLLSLDADASRPLGEPPATLSVSYRNKRHSLWGHKLWNAAKYLVKRMEQGCIQVQNKAVLELGAGLGVPSLSAYLNGARLVVCTDYPDADLLDIIQLNVDNNCKPFPTDAPLSYAAAAAEAQQEVVQPSTARVAKVEPLLWGKAEHIEKVLSYTNGKGYDVVILSDILFNHVCNDDLAATVAATLSWRAPSPAAPRDSGVPVAYCVFSHHRAHKQLEDFEFFDKCIAKGLFWEQIDQEDYPMMFPEDRGPECVRQPVKVFRITRQPPPQSPYALVVSPQQQGGSPLPMGMRPGAAQARALSQAESKADVVIQGTSLPQCLLAAALSRAGLKVLQCDAAGYYGGPYATLPLHDFIEALGRDPHAFSLSKPHRNRIGCAEDCRVVVNTMGSECTAVQPAAVLVDLLPQSLFNRGEMVQQLLDSRLTRFVEFQFLDRLLYLDVCDGAPLGETSLKLQDVPLTRAGFFAAPADVLPLLEKRRVMQLVKDLEPVLVEGFHAPNAPVGDTVPAQEEQQVAAESATEKFLQDCEAFVQRAQPSPHHTEEGGGFAELLQAKYRLSDTARDIATLWGQMEHVPGLAPPCASLPPNSRYPAWRRAVSLQRQLLTSAGRFKAPTPFLQVDYGVGELPQAMTRVAAISGGGLFALDRSVQRVVLHESTGEDRLYAVMSNNGQQVETKVVVLPDDDGGRVPLRLQDFECVLEVEAARAAGQLAAYDVLVPPAPSRDDERIQPGAPAYSRVVLVVSSLFFTQQHLPARLNHTADEEEVDGDGEGEGEGEADQQQQHRDPGAGQEEEEEQSKEPAMPCTVVAFARFPVTSGPEPAQQSSVVVHMAQHTSVTHQVPSGGGAGIAGILHFTAKASEVSPADLYQLVQRYVLSPDDVAATTTTSSSSRSRGSGSLHRLPLSAVRFAAHFVVAADSLSRFSRGPPTALGDFPSPTPQTHEFALGERRKVDGARRAQREHLTHATAPAQEGQGGESRRRMRVQKAAMLVETGSVVALPTLSSCLMDDSAPLLFARNAFEKIMARLRPDEPNPVFLTPFPQDEQKERDEAMLLQLFRLLEGARAGLKNGDVAVLVYSIILWPSCMSSLNRFHHQARHGTMLTDRTIGSILLTVSTALTLYYVVWMIGMPFVDSEHSSQAFFPPKVYGLVLPSIFGGVLLTGTVVIGSLHGIWRTGYEPSVLIAVPPAQQLPSSGASGAAAPQTAAAVTAAASSVSSSTLALAQHVQMQRGENSPHVVVSSSSFAPPLPGGIAAADSKINASDKIGCTVAIEDGGRGLSDLKSNDSPVRCLLFPSFEHAPAPAQAQAQAPPVDTEEVRSAGSRTPDTVLDCSDASDACEETEQHLTSPFGQAVAEGLVPAAHSPPSEGNEGEEEGGDASLLANNTDVQEVVYDFQATLQESVLSSTLEVTANALAQTLQHLLTGRQQAAAAHEDERRVLQGQLDAATGAVAQLTQQLREERKAAAAPVAVAEEANESGDLSPHTAPEKLLAAYAQAVGHQRVAEEEARRSKAVNSQLRELIASLIRDNSALRQEVGGLRLDTVPRKVYEEEVRVHQVARHQLAQLRLQVEAATVANDAAWEKHEQLIQQQALVIQQYEQEMAQLKQAAAAALGAAPTAAAAQEKERQAPVSGGTDAAAPYPAELWRDAVADLEARARRATELEDEHHQLNALRHDLQRCTAEKEAATTALERTTVEADHLRHDAQQLTFRNAVLAQQLSSLLCRVQQLEREQQAAAAAAPSLEAAAPQQRNVQRGNGAAEQDVDHWRLKLHERPAACRREGIRAAQIASSVVQQRSRSLLSASSSLDVLLAPVQPQQPKDGRVSTLEVTSTLSQQLGVFAAPSSHQRQRVLRNLRGAAEEAAVPIHTVSVPCLPACDQLTGVALSRPSSHCVLDPRTGAVAAVGGVDALPPGLLDVVGDLGDGRRHRYPLEVFSVNRVEELVERNQQLLAQLYAAGGHPRSPAASPADTHKEATEGERSPQQKRMGGDDPIPRLSAGVVGTTHGAVEEEEAEEEPIRRRESAANGGPLVDGGTEGAADRERRDALASTSLDALAERVMRTSQQVHHHAHAQPQDHTLSGHLVDVVAAMYEQQVAQARRSASAPLLAPSSPPLPPSGAGQQLQEASLVMASLVELCCSQAVQLAQQAMAEAASAASSATRDDDPMAARRPNAQTDTEREQQLVKAHQQAVERLLGNLKQTLWDACVGVAGPLHAEATAAPTSSRTGGGVVVEAAHVELLHSILHLLQNAAQKDEMLQLVLRSTHEQHVPFLTLLHQHQRRQERAARRKAKDARRTNQRPGQKRRREQERGSRTPPLQQRPPPPLGTATATAAELSGSLRPAPTPALGSACRFSPLPPSTSVVGNVLAAAQRPARGRSSSPDSGSSTRSSSLASSLEKGVAGAGVPARGLVSLQERLALASAAHAKAVADLEAERGEHLSLLEEMWKMELERDEAVRTAAEQAKQMEAMIPKAALEELQQEVDRLGTALRTAEAAAEASRGAMEAQRAAHVAAIASLEERIASEAAQHQEGVASAEARLKAKDEVLAAQQERESTWTQQEATLQQECLDWQQRSAETNAHVEALEKQLRGLREKLYRTQMEFLSQESVQEVLQSMYGADSISPCTAARRDPTAVDGGEAQSLPEDGAEEPLTHYRINTDLIQHMREEREKLRRQIAHDTLHIQRLENNAAVLEREKRNAQQQAQAAQLELLQCREQLQLRGTAAERTGGGEERDADAAPSPRAWEGVSALQHEVQSLRDELRVLQQSEEQWRQRETALRQQVRVMSRDPISEAARRYGVAACVRMEEQMEELHQRNLDLIADVTRLEEQKRSVESELAASRAAHAESQKEMEVLHAAHDALLQQHAQLQAELDGKVEQLKRVAAAAEEQGAALAELQQQHAEECAAHTHCAAQLEEMKDGNLKLVEQLESLAAHLTAAEKKEAAALQRVAAGEAALKKAKADAAAALAAAAAQASAAPARGGSVGVSSARLRPQPQSGEEEREIRLWTGGACVCDGADPSSSHTPPFHVRPPVDKHRRGVCQNMWVRVCPDTYRIVLDVSYFFD
eukprot:gene1348-785_t